MDISKIGVGKRIFNLRKSLGFTMKEFGEHLGDPVASDSIVSRWEKGKSLPNNERLKLIAELGNISVDELLYGIKIINPKNVTFKYYASKMNIIKNSDLKVYKNYNFKVVIESHSNNNHFFSLIDSVFRWEKNELTQEEIIQDKTSFPINYTVFCEYSFPSKNEIDELIKEKPDFFSNLNYNDQESFENVCIHLNENKRKELLEILLNNQRDFLYKKGQMLPGTGKGTYAYQFKINWFNNYDFEYELNTESELTYKSYKKTIKQESESSFYDFKKK